MGKFEFQTNTVTLDLAGHSFSVDPVKAELSARQLAGREQETAKQLIEGPTTPETVERAIRLLLDEIDGILGEGAAEQIFQGREVGLYDCLDLTAFIVGELAAFNHEKAKKYRAAARVKR